eukprot:1160500-Pelagomonas_calceolata.AAC.3
MAPEAGVAAVHAPNIPEDGGRAWPECRVTAAYEIQCLVECCTTNLQASIYMTPDESLKELIWETSKEIFCWYFAWGRGSLAASVAVLGAAYFTPAGSWKAQETAKGFQEAVPSGALPHQGSSSIRSLAITWNMFLLRLGLYGRKAQSFSSPAIPLVMMTATEVHAPHMPARIAVKSVCVCVCVCVTTIPAKATHPPAKTSAQKRSFDSVQAKALVISAHDALIGGAAHGRMCLQAPVAYSCMDVA